MQQTKVQNSNSIRFGSGKVEVGDDVDSLVNLGAMEGVTFEEEWDEVEVESDNAGIIHAGIQNQTAAISGDLYEVDLSNLSEIRGGLDNFEEITENENVSGTQEVAAEDWDFNEFIKLEEQNNVTVDTVEGNDTTYTEDTDYYVGENAMGETGIFIVDTTDTDTNHDLAISYTYDQVAAQVLKSGGRTTIEPKVVRITNVDEEGNKFQITIFKARNQEGISLELQGDDEGEPATTPINLEGSLDEERDAGEQLFEIYDEQGVA